MDIGVLSARNPCTAISRAHREKKSLSMSNPVSTSVGSAEWAQLVRQLLN